MPGAGHVVHMPSHIYYRVGRYADAAKVNALAALVDEQYIAQCHAQGFYPIGYYGHNIHFLWTSSAMEGRYQAAIDAARRLVKAIGPDAAKLGPMAQLYYFVPIATLLRFGKWDEILAEPVPQPDMKVVVAMSHLARGFAFANKGNMADAQKEREGLAAVASDPVLADYGMVPAAAMTKIALAELDGEMARLSGNLDLAIKDFNTAAALHHELPYTEPPYWHQPVSHLLGAALLQAGRAPEAEAVYRESLKSYRLDGWALYGLAQAQDAQGHHDEANATRKEFDAVWQLADVKLASSRF
jgi:tetratricopeptide (TPR) repeat protein